MQVLVYQWRWRRELAEEGGPRRVLVKPAARATSRNHGVPRRVEDKVLAKQWSDL